MVWTKTVQVILLLLAACRHEFPTALLVSCQSGSQAIAVAPVSGQSRLVVLPQFAPQSGWVDLLIFGPHYRLRLSVSHVVDRLKQLLPGCCRRDSIP